MDQQRSAQQYHAQNGETSRRDPKHDEQDDHSRRRDQDRDNHLTRREREERWPLG